MNASPSRYLPRLLLVLPLELPSATIYIWKPLSELARQKRIVLNKALESQVTTTLLQASDVVMFCRNNDPTHKWIINECLANNIPTTYDLDDNFWEVPQELPYAALHRAPERLSQVEYYLKHVSLVRVYSQYLQNKIAGFNQSITLARPCIDMRLVPRQSPEFEKPFIRITYATGRGGDDALLNLFSNDLGSLINAFPGIVEMYWWGEIPNQFRGHPAHHLVDIIHDYDAYVKYLAHSGFDIGLAPLTSSHFNLSKTNTKFRDYGACRIAGIYSNVDVYAEVEHERTGLIVTEREGAWLEAMSRLVTDSALRQNIQENAYQYTNEHYRQELAEQEWLDLLQVLLKNNRRFFKIDRDSQPIVESCKANFINSDIAPISGFINIASQPCRGASLIANPHHDLPFAEGSLDGMVVHRADLASQNADHLLREVYRVSKHGSQICLIAEYTPPLSITAAGETQSSFNEYTPYRWTAGSVPVYRKVPIYSEIPQGYVPAEKLIDVDIRCVQMHLFYTPEYLHSREEKRRLRWINSSICDEILYLCVVWKHAEDYSVAIQGDLFSQPLVPDYIVRRYLDDTNESLRQELDSLHEVTRSWRSAQIELETILAKKESELVASRNALAEADANARQALEVAEAAAAQHLAEVQATANRTIEEAKEALRQAQAEAEHTLQQTKAQADKTTFDLEQRLTLVSSQYQTLSEQFRTLSEQHQSNLQSFDRELVFARLAVSALDEYRNRKVFRLLERMFDRSSMVTGLPVSLHPILDDSLLFSQDLGKWHLQISLNLQRVPYLCYKINPGRENVCEIVLAPAMDILPRQGVLGVEIISTEQEILAQSTIPANQLDFLAPVHIQFAPIHGSASNSYELRVFARDLDVPLRIYEWHRYSPLGLGPTRSSAFCGFGFSSQS